MTGPASNLLLKGTLKMTESFTFQVAPGIISQGLNALNFIDTGIDLRQEGQDKKPLRFQDQLTYQRKRPLQKNRFAILNAGYFIHIYPR